MSERGSRQTAAASPASTWARQQVVRLTVALQFLTLVPPIIRRPFTAEELGGSVGWFSAVGAAIGLLLATLGWGLGQLFAPSITAGLLLAAWVAASGALHLDGLLDAADGLLGGRSVESRLRIMHDERVGAYGLAAGVLVMLLKYASLSTLANRGAAMVLAATLGRWAIAAAIVLAPYVRPQGLGTMMKERAGRAEVLLASLVALAVALLAAGWAGLIAALVAGCTVWGVTAYARWRIGGLTGDIYGALCELTELVVLLAFAALGGRL
jgi:adenosylcobinamide-GDP ribazoletransferase